jgi:RNA polymerase primary sigma factor
MAHAIPSPENARWQPLPREQEAHLAALVRLGDREALALLVAANMRFVKKVARRYRHCGLPMEDLVAEGCLGILQAAGRFDPSHGTRFVTYAVWWIRKAILIALGERSRLVRLPEGQTLRILEHRRSVPSPSRGRTVAPARHGSRIFHPPAPGDAPAWGREMSLEEAASAAGGRTPLDWLRAADPSVEQELIRADRTRSLRGALERLTSQEREVLALRFGLDDRPVLTLRELGRRMDLSNEGVRQIEMHAKRRLALLLRSGESGRRLPAGPCVAPDSSGAPARPARPGRGSGRSRRAASAPAIS